MIRGWYIGASGMNAQQNRLDAISNNLANVDTTGFKRDIATSKSFSELLIRRTRADGVYETPFGSADVAPIVGKLGLGVETNELYTDFSQGSFKSTDTATDFALNGKGFFAVQTPDGERYTRNGDFFLGKEGVLLTKEGYPVLGENGPIHVDDDKFHVNEDGMIYAKDVDGIPVDRLRIVRFENERYLKKQGGSLWRTTEISGGAHIAEGDERPKVLQRYTETSNVNVVNEMVQMIEVNRAYEANQKSIQSEDSMMDTLWNRVVVVSR
ncbi:MAG: flagellar basal-body rod protein FlgF [Treponema sp.]|nr:flagellar basal-body rod protein FlgF [Treponema sp.]